MVRAAARNKVMIYSYRERLMRPSRGVQEPHLLLSGVAGSKPRDVSAVR